MTEQSEEGVVCTSFSSVTDFCINRKLLEDAPAQDF